MRSSLEADAMRHETDALRMQGLHELYLALTTIGEASTRNPDLRSRHVESAMRSVKNKVSKMLEDKVVSSSEEVKVLLDILWVGNPPESYQYQYSPRTFMLVSGLKTSCS